MKVKVKIRKFIGLRSKKVKKKKKTRYDNTMKLDRFVEILPNELLHFGVFFTKH